MKTCINCQTEQPDENFRVEKRRNGTTMARNQCNECFKAQNRMRANRLYKTRTQQKITLLENSEGFSPGGQFMLSLSGWRVFKKMNNPHVEPVEVPRYQLWSMVGNLLTKEARQIMERKHEDYIFRKFDIKTGKLEKF